MNPTTLRLASLVSDFGWAGPLKQAPSALAAQRIGALASGVFMLCAGRAAMAPSRT